MGLNEADTRAKLIDPALHKIGWTEDMIRREITAGTIEIINGKTKRKKGRTDYLLCLPVKERENPLSIGVLEAKKEGEHATLGLGQAKEYAKSLNVPFVFSTNGHLFVEYDSFGEKVTEELSIGSFPEPELLKKLYEESRGFSLADDNAKLLFVPYRGGQSERRYYQDAAIRAALEKIAGKKEGWNRVLLSLATGSGKTRIAVQLLHKLAEAGHLRKALFVCDRNELRKQGFGQLFSVFGDNAAFVENKNPQKNARIIVSTYQALGIDEEGDQSFFLQNYPENYFSHIIIDEAENNFTGAVGQQRVPTSFLENYSIIVPPIVEQQQIVDKFDKHMAQIEIMNKEAEEQRAVLELLFESIINEEMQALKSNLSDKCNLVNLENVCDLRTGGTPSKSQPEFFGGDIKWIVSGDVNKEFIYDVDGRITEAGYKNSNAKMLPTDSVLIALNGQGKTRGMVAILKTEATCNQSLIAFTPKNKKELDHVFLFYYLRGCYQKLRNLTGDKERSGLSMSTLRPFQVIMPPIDIQRKVAVKLQKKYDEIKEISINLQRQKTSIEELPNSILNEVFGQYQINS